MANPNNKRNTDKQKPRDITLMTILAYEAMPQSIALVKRHNPKVKITGYADLEFKLAELYKNSSDKIALEKEMAEIHPHKNWILKRANLPATNMSIEAPVIKVDPVTPAVQKEDTKKLRDELQAYSNFDAKDIVPSQTPNTGSYQGCSCQQQKPASDIGLVLGVLGVVGLITLAIVYSKPRT